MLSKCSTCGDLCLHKKVFILWGVSRRVSLGRFWFNVLWCASCAGDASA